MKISGSLRSSLANQPSETTLCPRNGEVADETNPCIAMIMGNALEKGHTLIYDQILRRDHDSDGVVKYPKDLVQCHESFIQDIRESSDAKVEVICRKIVRKRVMRDDRFKFDILPLWGDYSGVSIVLDRESNYKNSGTGHTYRRIIVFALHPERSLYPISEENQRQDKLVAVAARISQVQFKERYYTIMLWKGSVPTSFRNAIRRKYFNTKTNELPVVELSASKGQEKDLNVAFINGVPSSISASRVLVRRALAEIHIHGDLDGLDSLVDFPNAVQEWLKGQNEVLFKSWTTTSCADIRNSYKQLNAALNGPSVAAHSLSRMVDALMNRHAAVLNGLKQSAKVDLVYCDILPNKAVEIVCKDCNQGIFIDTKTRWSVNRPGLYVVRERRCNSRTCQGKNKSAIPVSKDIPYIWQSRSDLQTTIARQSNKRWRADMTLTSNRQNKLPTEVITWCYHCLENTRLKTGEATYKDKSPEWLVGEPARYIERRVKCAICIANGKSGDTRFVPVNDAIPSVDAKRVAELREIWGNLSEEVRADVVGSVPSATRIPRRKGMPVHPTHQIHHSTKTNPFQKFVYVGMPPRKHRKSIQI